PVSNINGKRPQGICGMYIVNEDLAYACGRYYGSGRVIKTTDKGISWNLVFSDTSIVKTLIDIYFWSPDSGIAVGGNNANLQGNAVIIKTTNGGVSWQRVHVTPRQTEWCWKISFINVNTGFVSIERPTGLAYILKTTNNGNNWFDIPFRNYDEEGIGFVNENTGWVGGWTGPTYQTTNGGLNWTLAGWGTNVNRFRFLSDTLAFAVGDRIYKYSRDIVGIHNISSEIPVEFNLKQNYPNPFNPETNLEFEIAEPGFVSLKIYDGLGREVLTLVNQILSPGTYNYQLSSVNFQLSSGIYFYRLTAGNYSSVKKMIILQ
ncbi:MAG TPA: T9SS type A sorting domain-containing protein, partial [Ignavibacteria bacterium]|nr:T9SS type A sorting domain-containing protein [Ignavibacteria bacterium]HMR39171.1 T9SS type A sorting domain-containing protein [Ignavibacteria bacterium]